MCWPDVEYAWVSLLGGALSFLPEPALTFPSSRIHIELPTLLIVSLTVGRCESAGAVWSPNEVSGLATAEPIRGRTCCLGAGTDLGRTLLCRAEQTLESLVALTGRSFGMATSWLLLGMCKEMVPGAAAASSSPEGSRRGGGACMRPWSAPDVVPTFKGALAGGGSPLDRPIALNMAASAAAVAACTTVPTDSRVARPSRRPVSSSRRW